MTTPHQPLPDSLSTLLGIGAFQIGGGTSHTHYGQDITQEFVDALTKIPFPTLANMFDVLEQILLKLPMEALQAFQSIVPGLGVVTDVVEAVQMIIDSLSPRAIIATIEDWLQKLEQLIFGGPDDGGAFPLEFPAFGESGAGGPISMFFYWIRKFTGIDDFDDLFNINLIDLIRNFIESLLKPQELLAWLVDGILPDFQAPQLIHDVMDAIVKGFERIPVLGPLVQGVWDVIANLLGIGNDAQITGTDNSAEIAKIKAGLEAAGVGGGVSITDDFDRAAASTLGAAYTQTYSGAGGGTEGVDGNGYAHWSPSGASARRVINRHNTQLATDIQYSSFVLKDRVANVLTSPRRDLILRADATMQNYVMASVYTNSVTLTPVIGGVTGGAINGASGLSYKAGDFWEFFAGTAAEPYQFLIKQNGRTVLDITDSGHITQLGASYRYHAFGGNAGVHFLLLFFQAAPPDVAAYAAADRTG